MEAVECILVALAMAGSYLFGYLVRGQESGHLEGGYTQDPAEVRVITPEQARLIRERLVHATSHPVEWQKYLKDAGVVVFVRRYE